MYRRSDGIGAFLRKVNGRWDKNDRWYWKCDRGASGDEAAAAACSTAPFTFEEKSTVSGCNAAAGDDAGVAARAEAESLLTCASSRATRSCSHAPKPSAASPTTSASRITASGPPQAAALLGAKIRS